MAPRWVHTATAQQLLSGPGAVAELPAVLRAVGARRVLLVTSAGRAASPEGERVVRLLGRTLASTFASAQPHVPADVVQAAMRQARSHGVDAVVSFGGGSATDLAKAVAFFGEQEAGTPSSSFLDKPSLPHVAVPTTYGGSAVTAGFAVTDPRTRVKRGAGSATTAPVAVVLDPELTLGTPPELTAGTALAALAHAVEAAWSPARTPEAEALALRAAADLAQVLPAVLEEPLEVAARQALLDAATMAARALSNAAPGPQHALAQLLGGRTGLPHGVAHAVLLPHTTRFVAATATSAADRLATVLGAPVPDVAAQLLAAAPLPRSLEAAGVDGDELEVVARLSQQHPGARDGVAALDEAAALRVLEQAYVGAG